MSLIGNYKNALHFITSVREVIRSGYPARKLKVIGITGTDGKTTTSHLIYEILKKKGYNVALISTIGAIIADKTIDTGFHVTTPDAKLLQPLLRRMVKSGDKYLVMETTSHGLDQHRVLGCNFWAGVLTNVTHEHLDYHRTFEKYKKAKAKLFKKIKIAVLNKDDNSFVFFKSAVSKEAIIITYSLKKNALFRASGVKLANNKMQFLIIEKGKRYSVNTNLIGDYNVSNILAAVSVARQCGVDWITINSVLENFKGVPGRMELINLGQPFSVIIDFAHTPNALEKVLTTLSRVKTKDGRIICVFGCAGERDVGKRPMMGEISTKLADISIFTAEDPRSENVNNIINQIVKGTKKSYAREVDFDFFDGKPNRLNKHIFVRIPDRGRAISFAIQKVAKIGDIVAILGKGHEQSMAFGDTEIPWDDRKIARKLIIKMNQFRKN